MGWFMKEANARVVLVGLDQQTTKKLKPILLRSGVDDPGHVELHDVRTLAECRDLIEAQETAEQEITGICLNLESFTPAECIGLIADIRTTHPFIAFCLVGKGKYVDQLPGFHDKWKERFRHYFKLKTDQREDDFAQNAGALRDLLIADVVKCTALGQYQTTPGALVRLKAASPYGFWISLSVVALAAILGGAIGPAMDRLFPVDKPAAADVGNASTAGEGASP